MNKFFTLRLTSVVFLISLLTFWITSRDLHAQSNIALFYDGAYVDNGAFCGSEGTNLLNYYNGAGHTVTTFIGTTGASWTPALSGKDAVVIPEQENGQIVLDAAATTELQNFVSSGKVLLIHGRFLRAERFLNTVFGFSLLSAGGTSSGSSALFGSIPSSSCLASGAALPATLGNHSFTTFSTVASLPAGGIPVFGRFGSTQASVYEIPYGSGKIFFFGWDYFEGGPGCPTVDPDWNDLFERALSCALSCSTAPSVQFCPDTIKVGNDVDECGAYVNYAIVFADTCGDGTITHSLDMGATWLPGDGSGSYFAVDTIEVWVRDINANGGDTCIFHIAVMDTQKPDAVCTDVNAIVGAGCDATVAAHQVGFLSSDNCDTMSTMISKDNMTFSSSVSFTSADLPNSPVTVYMKVCDIHGNCDTCSAQVFLSDTTAPMITCPADMTIDNEPGQCYGKVPDLTAAVSDNCGSVSVTQTPPANSLFGSSHGDTIQVLLISEDNNGNKDTCGTRLTLNDAEFPELVGCPADVTIGTSAGGTGDCMGEFSWTSPHVQDNCAYNPATYFRNHFYPMPPGTNLVFHQLDPVNHPLHDDYPVGTTRVVYTVRDYAGHKDACSYTVTVVDDEAPMITCPSDMTVMTSAGGTGDCEGEASWTNPTPTDNCMVDSMNYSISLEDNTNISKINVTAGAAETQALPVGTHTVHYTVWDTSGNAASCSFEIRVIDDEDPQVTCPANVTLSTQKPLCAHTVLDKALDPVYTDNCPDSSIMHNWPFAPNPWTLQGATFPRGTTPVMWTVTDKVGNTATCIFTITVEDVDEPYIINCPDSNLVYSNDPGMCGAIPNWAPLIATDYCDGIDNVVLEYSLDMGATWTPGHAYSLFFPLDTSVVWYRARDLAGNISDTCMFNVIVNDDEAPDAVCTDVNAIVGAGCDATVTAHQVGFLSSDNCDTMSTMISRDNITYSASLNFTSADLGSSPITVYMKVCDTVGNCDTCTALVFLSDTTAPMITCPADMTIDNEPGQCHGKVPDLTATVSDNCGGVTVTQEPPANSLFGSSHGDTMQVLLISEDTHGNKDTCITKLTLNDAEFPELVGCPADVTIGTSAGGTGDCMGELSWTSPHVQDNCSYDPGTYFRNHYYPYPPGTNLVFHQLDPVNHPLHDDYPVGTTRVVYTVRDSAGHKDACSYTVTVVDDEPPVITCPADMTVMTSAGGTGDCSGEANWTNPTPTDNCAIDTMNLVITYPDNSVELRANVTLGGAETGMFPKGVSSLKYTVWDTTGNMSMCTFEIAVQDDEVPMVTCPADVTFGTDAPECEHLVTDKLLDATFTDNCPDSSVMHNYPFAPNPWTLQGATFPLGTTVVQWTATDKSGNTATCSFMVTVEDNDAPMIINCPDSVLVYSNDPGSCGAVPNFAPIVAEDNCSGLNVMYRYSLDKGGSWTAGQAYSLYYAVGSTEVWYVAEDMAGNVSDTCKFVVQVNDDEAPDAVCTPVTVAVGAMCDAVVTAEQVGFLSSDNCDSITLQIGRDTMTLSDHVDFTIADLPNSPITVHLKVCDTVGNCSWCSTAITLIDTSAPVITCPADMTINNEPGFCYGKIPDIGATAFSDNCGTFTITQTPAPGLLFGSHHGDTLSVQLVIEDNNNNRDTCSVLLTLNDNENPFVVCPLDVTVGTSSGGTGDCNGDYTWLHPVPDDNCHIDSLNLVITDALGGIVTMNDVPPGGTITHTFGSGVNTLKYTAIDSAGNMAMCTWTVTIVDNEDPVVTCPADITVGTSAGGTGDCTGDASWTNPTPTDNCMVDTMNLVITYPDNSIELRPNVTAGGVESGTFPKGVSSLKYTVWDTTGNMSMCTFKITVQDDEAPQVTCHADVTLLTDPGVCEVVLGSDSLDATFTDNCPDSTIAHNWPFAPNPWTLHGGTFTLGTHTITWTATDKSGNTASCQMNITIEDHEAPVFLNCPDSNWVIPNDPGWCGAVANFPQLIGNDNCTAESDLIYEYSLDMGASWTTGQAGSLFYPIGMTEVWHRVTDTVGNVGDTCMFKVIVLDKEYPNAVCTPVTVYMSSTCEGYVTAEQIGGLSTDNCDSIQLKIGRDTITLSDTIFFNMGDLDTSPIVVHLRVCDSVGNCSWCSTNVHLKDTIPPGIVCPPDFTMDVVNNACYIELPDIAAMSFTDNCNIYSIEQTPPPGTNVGSRHGEVVTVTLVITDNEGNTDTCMVNITLNDATPPELACPANVTIGTSIGGTGDCEGLHNWSHPLPIDNCHIDSLNVKYTFPDGSMETEMNVSHGDTTSKSFPLGTTQIKYTTTDSAGNSTMCFWSVTVVDDEDPIITCPADVRGLVCGDIPPAGATDKASFEGLGGTISDNCTTDAFTVTYIDQSNGLSTCNFDDSLVITRTYTVTDSSGNFTTCEQRFIYDEDVTPPVITGVPNDTLVACAEEVPAVPTVSATDNCMANEPLNIDFNEVVTNDSCHDKFVLTRTWTAYDNCNNSSSASYTITVRDTIPPVLHNVPADTLVLCQEEIPGVPSNVFATDNCGQLINIEFNEVTVPRGCDDQYDVVRTWKATDACGNFMDSTQTILVRDTIPPVITGGADYEILCDQSNANNDDELISWLNNNAGAIAVDNCSQVTWSNNYIDTNWVDGCGNTRYVDVTFYATDECDNVDSVTFRFGTIDTIPPVFQNCPRLPVVENAETGHCDAYVNFSAPYALDNCTDTVLIRQIDGTGLHSGSRFPVGTTILIFEATDGCGNSDTCEYKIIVNDYWDPPLLTCPQVDSIDNDPEKCGATVFNLKPTVVDTCKDHVAVTYFITDSSGAVIAEGVEDASGEYFPVGDNKLTYIAQDQPIVLITEVTQMLGAPVGATNPVPGHFDGDLTNGDYVEITNFGPTTMDLTCLTLEIVDAGGSVCSRTLPNGTMLGVGQTLVFHVGMGADDPANSYFSMNCAEAANTDPRGYVLSLYDHVIDVVTTNGFDPVGAGTIAVVEADDWSGVSADMDCHASYYRSRLQDHNNETDWVLAESCAPATLGSLNAGLPVLTDNGTVASLQSTDPGVDTCMVDVIVSDVEIPSCVEYDTMIYNGATNLNANIAVGDCYTSVINVPTNGILGDINVLNLTGTADDVNGLEVTLISPSGTEVVLFEGACSAGDNDFDFSLMDDDAANDLAASGCNPLGSAGESKPMEPLKAFYEEPMMGDWTLQIANNSCASTQPAQLTNWELQIMQMLPYSQGDTTFCNDTLVCGGKFMWTHPIFEDNCCLGDIYVEYSSKDPIVVPTNGPVVGGSVTMEFFEVGTTTVRYILTDKAGNKSSCSFDVTVEDCEDPVITNCPADLTLQANPGECEVFWSYGYIVTDNCGVDTIYANPPDATYLGIGEHEIVVIAKDSAGNADTCIYTVTVNEFDPAGNELACVDQTQLSLDSTCTAVLTADMVLSGDGYHCYSGYELEVREGCGKRDGLLHSDTFTLSDVGKCFTVTVIDPRSGNSCWGCVCIEDKLAPVIECPPDTAVPCAVAFTPSYTGRPTILSCVQNPSITYHDKITDNGKCKKYRLTIERKWTVKDGSGNTTTCTQMIYVKEFDLADVTFPADVDDLTVPGLSCDKAFDEIEDEKIDPTKEEIRPGVPNPHFPAYAVDLSTGCRTGCVDDYVLDTVIYKASGCRIRVPRSLGWNVITDGVNAGHPSPFPIYYRSHWQWVKTGGRRCFGGYPTNDPEALSPYVKWTGTGVPTIGGKSVFDKNKYCNYSYKYEDEVYDACEGEYEIHRHWKVVSKCLPVIPGINPLVHTQVIRVIDREGPKITFPEEVTVGMTSTSCFGRWLVPEPWLEDNCSAAVGYKVLTWTGRAIKLPNGQWIVIGLAEGTHTVVIEAEDACGNVSQLNVTVHVVDNIPPTPVCETHTVVSLVSSNDRATDFVKIKAKTFDDGSFDNCKEVWFKVIRMDETLGKPNGSTADNRVACNGLDGDDDLGRTGNQVYFDDEVSFCCQDVGQNVMVVFRVFDVDPGPGPISPSTMERGRLKGHFSDCMVEVEVQNKALPIVHAPDDVVVSCSFWFDDSEEALTDPNNPTFGRVVTDKNLREKLKTTDVVCPRWCEDIDQHYLKWFPHGKAPQFVPIPAVSEKACFFANKYYNPTHPENKYSLVWGWDGFVSKTCGISPTITVNDGRECGQGVITRTITVTVDGVRYQDKQQIWVVNCDPFYIDPVVCTSNTDDIEWPNGCNETITLDGCGADLDPSNPQLGKPVIVNGKDDQCSSIAIDYKDDTITITRDACFKVIRDWSVIDWCQWDPDKVPTTGNTTGYYTHPHPGEWHFRQIILVRDKISPVVTCSHADCEPDTYRDTVINGQRYCVGHIDLNVSATDECTPTDKLYFDYKIDLYNDRSGKYGTYDVFVGRALAGQQAVDYFNPWADNELDPSSASGTYPVGEHMLQYYVEDGCGNVGVCNLLFEVKDCKKPTPYCEDGAVTVIMPSSGSITVWATDLDAGSYDNCSDTSALKLYFNGDPSWTGYTVTCDTFTAHGAKEEVSIEVELWVEDEAGNTDFCVTTIIVQDNNNACGNTTNLAGIVVDRKDEVLGSVLVRLEDQNGAVLKTKKSGGKFIIPVPQNAEYIDIFKNEDWLNGVNTRDLVAIQLHLLGKKDFTDAYQYIAADATNNEKVSTADILVIRKLILGKIKNLDKWKQTSWRFMPKGHMFTDYHTPWGYPERLPIQSLIEAELDANFRGVKIGDVSGDARANLTGKTKVRTDKTLQLRVDDVELQPGKRVSIDVTAANFNEMVGMQYSMEFDPQQMDFVEMQPGKLKIDPSNYNAQMAEQGVLTFSWNILDNPVTLKGEEVLFTLVFTGKEQVKNPLLKISSAVTSAEGYDAKGRDYEIALRYESSAIAKALPFRLYQNSPNPFKEETEIRFDLPEDMNVQLTFYTDNGKIIKKVIIDGQQGENKLVVASKDLGEKGRVIYYQLDSEDYTATKKMILIK